MSDVGDGDVVRGGSRLSWSLGTVGAAFLLLVAFFPSFNDPDWVVRLGLNLLLGATGVPLIVAQARHRGAVDVVALALVGVATASALASSRPALSLLGSYGGPGSAALVAGALGAWALGERLDGRARSLLSKVILAATYVSVAIALLQGFVDLKPYRLDAPLGSSGLLGNPVHLGALLGGATAIVGYSVVHRSRLWLLGIVPIAVALPFSGSRMGAVAALAVTVPLLRHGRRAAILLTVLILGFALGEGLQRLGVSSTSTTVEKVGALQGVQVNQRVDAWAAAVGASLDRPLGYGPGRFVEVSSPATTLRQARSAPDTVYTDAHNLFFEYLATTGVVGAGLLLLFLATVTRHGHGPMMNFGLGALIVYLLQPQSLAMTPVVFMALGASSTRTGLAVVRPMSAVPLAAATSVLVALLLAGDLSLRQANLDFKEDDARRAERLLFAWPEASGRRAVVAFFDAQDRKDDDQRAQALLEAGVAFAEAAERDPAIATHWNNLADVQLFRSDPVAARLSFRQALVANPYSLRALIGLAAIDGASGDPASAGRHLDRAALIVPRSVARQMVADRM